MRIRILRSAGQATATLEATPTTEALWAELSISSSASTWGGEVYFGTPVSVPREGDARQVVEPGTVAFRTDGDSLALPYGPTPIAHDGECRLAGPCDILGGLDGNARVLRTAGPAIRSASSAPERGRAPAGAPRSGNREAGSGHRPCRFDDRRRPKPKGFSR
ncbi:cyclophilin-like family protein [Kitasatospora sp. NPDC086801]|uniref:cyclophilin-like family protein n=1 Tax=Kitasatospora sp. NPDC086801 TaxID=3364066 RepID=UPI00380DB6FA